MENLLGMNSVLPFGKHEGRQVRGVFSHDPEYIHWAAFNEIFKFDAEVLDKVTELAL